MSRVSPALLLLLMFGLLVGLAGAYVVRRELSRVPAAKAAAASANGVIPLAVIDLPVGRKITNGDLFIWTYTPAQFAAAKFPYLVMYDVRQIIGRTLQREVKRGQPFELGVFYPDGTGPDVATRLRADQRAVTISVVGISAVAAQAVPGAYVDVIFRNDPDPKEEMVESTVVLVEAVQIVALGSNATPGLIGGIVANAKGSSPVTLAVTVEEAAKLKAAEGHGEMSLVLRGEPTADSSSALQAPLTLRDLLNQPGKRKPQSFTAEIYRGGSRQTLVFKDAQVVHDVYSGGPPGSRNPSIQPPYPGQQYPNTPNPSQLPPGGGLYSPYPQQPGNGSAPGPVPSSSPTGPGSMPGDDPAAGSSGPPVRSTSLPRGSNTASRRTGGADAAAMLDRNGPDPDATDDNGDALDLRPIQVVPGDVST